MWGIILELSQDVCGMKTFDLVVELFNIVETGNWSSPMRGRIYSVYGLAPACNICSGGGHLAKILVYEEI